MDPRHAAYVEDVALYWEAQGLPRIAGRIVGWLMICDPPHRSARQLADDLGGGAGGKEGARRVIVLREHLEQPPHLERIAVGVGGAPPR